MKLKEKQAARDACVRGVPFHCGGHCIQPIPFDGLSGEDCCWLCEMDSECKGDIQEMCEYVNGIRGYDEFYFSFKETVKKEAMIEEEKREQIILNIAEAMRREHFTFEFKVKKKPAGIKIIYEVTQEEMNDIMSGTMQKV